MALKTMDTLYRRDKEMVRYVKGCQIIAAIYLTKQSEKNKSTTLKLPSNTHWSGVVIMFHSLLEEKESLQENAISVCRYGQPHQEDPPGLCILGESGKQPVQTLLADVREEIHTALPTSLLFQAE